ncbi:pumilio homolog 11-like [Prunus avium]|uniref:Pumilio homolog 11-like n=1 Tax=Prunus avium TaxID=42229 RepID=A0A6P5TXD8_PRUAV|nr:pumilio homolog 11-like [Prunus avium]
MEASCYAGSSIEEEVEKSLCLSLGKVRVKTDTFENEKPGFSVHNSNNTCLGSSSNASPSITQQAQPDVYPKYESGFENSPRVPVPLYPQSIWRDHILNGGGHFLGSNNLNGHANAYQPKNPLGNLTEETTKSRLSRGATSPSFCNWANQLNPCVNNWYQSSGEQYYRSNERIGMYSNGDRYPSSGISSYMGTQSSFNNDGCHGDQIFKLRSYADIARLAMTQPGSQSLINIMVASKDPFAKDMIFTGVFGSIFEVMNDSHGYYVFGKLIESCNYGQLRHMVAQMTLNTESLVSISTSKFGSKSIQRLVKVLEKSPLIYTLTLALSSVLEQLMTNRTGSFVILKCLNLLDTQKNEKIYETAERLCITLAQNEKGCIYLNEFITYSKTPYRERLMDEISSKSKLLSQDPSGNFVVQHVLGLHNPVFSAKICFELRDLYIKLSSQRGGSHVVEKCLNSSETDYVVNAFLKYEKLWQIARDQFGNYVIQTALKATKRANSPLYQMLLSKLEQNRNELMSGFGSKVLSLIDRGVPLD